MRYTRTPLILSAAFLTLAAFTGCASDELVGEEVQTAEGTLTLRLTGLEVYGEVNARATQTLANASLADYRFTLNGTSSEGETVTDAELTFTVNGDVAIAHFPAGDYTLTADNLATATEGAGTAYYSGTSETFTIRVADVTPVTLDLGQPKNARVNVTFSDDFKAKYENCAVIYNEATVADGEAFYAMPGTVDYKVTATAKAGTHVSDLPTEGVSGQMTVAATTAYPLVINLRAFGDDDMIGFGEDEYTGEFDSQKR